MITFLHVLEASQKSHGDCRISVSKNGRFFISVGKAFDDNLYPYHVVLTTKANDQRLRRSTNEKLSYTAQRNVFTHVLPRDPKHSPFSPTATVSSVSKKLSACFGSKLFI